MDSHLFSNKNINGYICAVNKLDTNQVLLLCKTQNPGDVICIVLDTHNIV